MLKILKNLIIPVCLLSLLLTSCVTDDGNYDYKDINEVKIEALPDTLSVLSFDTLRLKPKVDYSQDPAGDGDYSYRWTAFGTSGVNNQQAIDIGAQKNLDIVMQLDPGKYTVYYFVTDNETGIETQENFQMEVINSIYEGWLVLNAVGENSRLDMLSLVNGEFMPRHNILSLTNSELTLSGTPNFVQTYPYAPGFYGIYVSTSGNGTTKIEPNTFQWKESFRLSYEFASSQPEKLEASNISPKSGYKSYVVANNNVYYYSHPESIVYGSPINNVDGVPFKASKYIGNGSTRNPVTILYDNDNKRFMYNTGGLSSFPVPTPNNPLFNYDDGKDLLYMESNNYRNNNGNQTFAILKDGTTEKSYLAIFRANNPSRQTFYGEILATDFDQATQYAINPLYGYIFYNVGSKVYEYDPFTETTTLMIDKGDKQVSYLNTRANFGSSKYNEESRLLMVGSYDPAKPEGSNGTLEFYSVPSTRKQIVLESSYDGFGKIVSVAYRER